MSKGQLRGAGMCNATELRCNATFLSDVKSVPEDGKCMMDPASTIITGSSAD